MNDDDLQTFSVVLSWRNHVALGRTTQRN